MAQWLRQIVVILVLGTVHPAVSRESGITVTQGDDPQRPAFIATVPEGVAQDLKGPVAARKLLHVARIDDQTKQPGPPIFGTVTLEGGRLRFDPEFRLSAGSRYRATLSLPGSKPVSIDYTVPAAVDQQPAIVERVYPTGDQLPANLLKFYVCFSRPMRQTDRVFDQMHILDEKGKPVHDPWRRFQQWSDDGRRLTLWIHPGRVKQGVNLREELGPVLVPGQRFTLRLDATLEDLSGTPMAAAFEKPFVATEEDRTRLDLTQWKIAAPKTGSRDPLRVTFPKPLDHALVTRLITFCDESGRTMDGVVTVGAEERSCSFTPASPWRAGRYSVRADELLEDLAGNTPVRVFDADLAAPKTPPVTRITFEPSKAD